MRLDVQGVLKRPWLIVLAFAAITAPGPAFAGEIFRDEAAGFEVTVPEGWIVKHRGSGGTVRAYIGPPQGEVRSCSIKATEEFPAPAPTQEALDRVLTEAWALERAAADVPEPSEFFRFEATGAKASIIDVNGRKAALVEATMSATVTLGESVGKREGPIRTVYIFTPRRIYHISCAGGTDGQPWAATEAKALEQSFRVLP